MNLLDFYRQYPDETSSREGVCVISVNAMTCSITNASV
jgi:hypothetical protein